MLRPDDLIKAFVGRVRGTLVLVTWTIGLISFSVISGVVYEMVCAFAGSGSTTALQFAVRVLRDILIIFLSSAGLAYLTAYVVIRLRKKRA